MSTKTRSRSPIVRLDILAAGLLLALGSSPATAAEPRSAPAFSIVGRTVAQDQGGWLIDYRLRYRGASGMVVTPTEVLVKVEGWVSNSRVAAHATPKWSSLVVSGPAGLTGQVEVVNSADEALRCRERAIVQVWADDNSGQTQAPLPPAPAGSEISRAGAEPDRLPFSVAPDGIVRVRLRLEHAHMIFGDYDPLLGVRTLECQLGAVTFRDALPLDREQYLAQSKTTWATPPDDRRDTGVYLSAPDSLHLEAHIPGNQYYRFSEIPVRYATKMRLQFWYFIAAGTEGDCSARIAQYKDTPTAWKILTEGGHDVCLKTVGRWVKVERIFRTEPDATKIALDFRVNSPCDIGEMWVDDVTLEPIVSSGPAGP